MPSLGLAMILKDGSRTLQNCIASVAGVTDRIVIADTGSSDGSSQLARDLGAEVFDVPWQDDFSQARNAAVSALATDWVLIMDDDEELDPQARAKIPPLLDNASVGGYLVTLRNHIPVKFGWGDMRRLSNPAIRRSRERNGLELMRTSLFAACSVAIPEFITLAGRTNMWNHAFMPWDWSWHPPTL